MIRSQKPVLEGANRPGSQATGEPSAQESNAVLVTVGGMGGGELFLRLFPQPFEFLAQLAILRFQFGLSSGSPPRGWWSQRDFGLRNAYDLVLSEVDARPQARLAIRLVATAFSVNILDLIDPRFLFAKPSRTKGTPPNVRDVSAATPYILLDAASIDLPSGRSDDQGKANQQRNHNGEHFHGSVSPLERKTSPSEIHAAKLVRFESGHQPNGPDGTRPHPVVVTVGQWHSGTVAQARGSRPPRGPIAFRMTRSQD